MTAPLRKIIHLAVHGEGESTWPSAVVVCADGTAWHCTFEPGKIPTGWEQIPSIPGTEREPAS